MFQHRISKFIANLKEDVNTEATKPHLPTFSNKKDFREIHEFAYLHEFREFRKNKKNSRLDTLFRLVYHSCFYVASLVQSIARPEIRTETRTDGHFG